MTNNQTEMIHHLPVEAYTSQEWFAPIEPYLGPHKPEELVEYPNASTADEIKANWKVVVENYIDVYHLAHLHSVHVRPQESKKRLVDQTADGSYIYKPSVQMVAGAGFEPTTFGL